MISDPKTYSKIYIKNIFQNNYSRIWYSSIISNNHHGIGDAWVGGYFWSYGVFLEMQEGKEEGGQSKILKSQLVSPHRYTPASKFECE